MEGSEKKKQGFATMTPDKRRVIARKGGLTAHAQGRAHKFTREEAVVAGRKGGLQVARDAQHMAEIGRKGGLSRGRKDAETAPAAVPEPPRTAS